MKPSQVRLAIERLDNYTRDICACKSAINLLGEACFGVTLNCGNDYGEWKHDLKFTEENKTALREMHESKLKRLEQNRARLLKRITRWK